MDKTKKYELPENEPQMAGEAVVVSYNSSVAQGRFSSKEEADTDMESFIRKSDSMPCSYSDEEFKDELLLSEASGFVSNEEFKRTCLEKWGVVL